MVSLETIVSKYFPQERITHQYDVSLLTQKYSVFGVPFGFSSSLGSFLPMNIKLIETERFTFLDIRYKYSVQQKFLTFLSIAAFLMIFGKSFLSLSIAWITLFTGLFVISGVVEYYLNIYRGFGTMVYQNDWVKKDIRDGIMKMKVDIPKYSRDTVFNYILKSKVLDFLGVSITSAPIKNNYTFKIVNEINEQLPESITNGNNSS